MADRPITGLNSPGLYLPSSLDNTDWSGVDHISRALCVHDGGIALDNPTRIQPCREGPRTTTPARQPQATGRVRAYTREVKPPRVEEKEASEEGITDHRSTCYEEIYGGRLI